jgi:hypothetical protein
MNLPSLWWIDWSLHGKSMRRETVGRFLLCFLAASYFLAMLLSGGVDRFLAGQYTITAILRIGVPDDEGAGIAGKVMAVAPVREAQYRDPEEAWKEFLGAYPGLESLRSAGRIPLPGYVEIRLRPGGMSEEGIAQVRSALEPLPQVEKILSGGEIMPRLLRMKWWANVLLWSGFALVVIVFAVFLFLQEKARAARLLPDVSFLADRGVPGSLVATRRAAGAFVTGGLLALLAAGASCAALFILAGRFSPVRVGVGSAQELLDARFALPAVLFLLFATMLQVLASLAGWRAAFPKGR